jgi:hypothetical protein
MGMHLLAWFDVTGGLQPNICTLRPSSTTVESCLPTLFRTFGYGQRLLFILINADKRIIQAIAQEWLLVKQLAFDAVF